MPVYTPPALNAVDFALSVQPSHSVAPYNMALTSYTVPALNAVDFALVTYTPPVYNTIDFELLDVPAGGTTVDTLTGALILTGYSPSIGKWINVGYGELVLAGYAPTIVIAGGTPADPTNRRTLVPRTPFKTSRTGLVASRIKVIQSFEA